MNREIKEIRIKNTWQNTKINDKNTLGEKIYQLTNTDADISIISYRRYIGPYMETPNCNNEYTNIVYEILISPKINKTQVKGEAFSKEWINSVNEIQSTKDFKDKVYNLNLFLNKRLKEYDIAIEFKDIYDNIFLINSVSSFSNNEISFTERWIDNKDDFQILEEKNIPKKDEWSFSRENYDFINYK